VAQAARQVVALAFKQLANVRILVGAFPQAAELYRKSLELEEVPETHLNLAIVDLRANQTDDALDQSNIVLAANPNSARAWHIKGQALMGKQDYRGAIEALKHSQELSNDVNAEYALGFSYLKAGEKASAEKVFLQMLDSYGDKAIWHIVFAGAYREAGLANDAVREFKRGIAMDNNVDHAHFFLGLTLLEQNHWARTDESMAEFREAVRQYPKDFYGNFYLGVGESQLRVTEESNRHLKTATEADPTVAEPWLYLGLNAFQQDKLSEAKIYLLKAVELSAKQETQTNFEMRRGYIALGRIYFIEGNHEQAEKYVKRAKELQAKSLAASGESISQTMMAEGGMGQAAAIMPMAKMPEQTTAPVETVTVDPTAPMDPSVLANAPLSVADQAELQKMDAQLRAILSSAMNDWGTANARQGYFTQALERFHEAQQWDNSTRGLMRNIGIAALKVGDTEEGIRGLRAALKTEPQDQLARARLAMALFTADKYDEASKNFEALGDATFSDPNLAYAWAYSLVRTRQPNKAIEALNRLSALPVSAEMLISIGDLYGVEEDYEHAVLSYRRALQLQPTIAKAHYKMGAALIRLDRPGEAIPQLQAELDITPGEPDVQFNLAYALLQTSQKEPAMALLRTVVAADPRHPQAQYELGKALLEDGRLQEAIQHLEVAAKLDPSRDYIHYQLQTAYRRNGQIEEANREAKIYREIKQQKRDKVTLPMPERKQP